MVIELYFNTRADVNICHIIYAFKTRADDHIGHYEYVYNETSDNMTAFTQNNNESLDSRCYTLDH